MNSILKTNFIRNKKMKKIFLTLMIVVISVQTSSAQTSSAQIHTITIAGGSSRNIIFQ